MPGRFARSGSTAVMRLAELRPGPFGLQQLGTRSTCGGTDEPTTCGPPCPRGLGGLPFGVVRHGPRNSVHTGVVATTLIAAPTTSWGETSDECCRDNPFPVDRQPESQNIRSLFSLPKSSVPCIFGFENTRG